MLVICRRESSWCGLQVMAVVKTLVKSGMTITATIHSPTPFCFNLFDRMMILLGGSVIYNGHNGTTSPRTAHLSLAVAQLPRFKSESSVACRAAGCAFLRGDQP